MNDIEKTFSFNMEVVLAEGKKEACIITKDGAAYLDADELRKAASYFTLLADAIDLREATERVKMISDEIKARASLDIEKGVEDLKNEIN